MPQIDVTVFFFEMLWFFLFFIGLVTALVHFFLIPNAEVRYGGGMEAVARQWQLGREISRLALLAVLQFPRRILPVGGSGANLPQLTTWAPAASLPLLPGEKLPRNLPGFCGDYSKPADCPEFLLWWWLRGSMDDVNPQDFVFFHPVFSSILNFDLLALLCLLVGVLLSVAFFTLVERKVMASSQRRKGPDLVGFWGVLQPIADGLKLVVKENVVPQRANGFLFFVAALLPFVMAFASWIFLPLSAAPLADASAGLPLLLAFSSIGVYGIIFSGWASNSKYAFLGGLRSAAQVISYELVLGFCYLCVILLAHSMNLTSIVYAQRHVWFVVPLLPVAVMFLIAMLAETNRTPFDLPEAEAELVAGYNVEYSSLLFAFFFLAEYANMLLMASIFTLLFLGGWLPLLVGGVVLLPGGVFFILKILTVVIFFVVVRAALPRVRYDQLMLLSWKLLLPLEFGLFFFYVALVYGLEHLL